MGWTPELETGDPTIDEQHRTLLGDVERFFVVLRRGDKKAAGVALAALRAVFESHAAVEEDLMSRSRYPLSATHRAAHASVFRQFRWLAAELEVDENLHQLIETAKGLLDDYVAKHVAGSDRALVRWLQRRGSVPLSRAG